LLNGKQADILEKSKFRLSDYEVGAEIMNNKNTSGSIVAAFSKSKLTYN
jgi:hypothetical protein